MLIDVQIIYIRVMFNWDTALLTSYITILSANKKKYLLFVLSCISYRTWSW